MQQSRRYGAVDIYPLCVCVSTPSNFFPRIYLPIFISSWVRGLDYQKSDWQVACVCVWGEHSHQHPAYILFRKGWVGIRVALSALSFFFFLFNGRRRDGKGREGVWRSWAGGCPAFLSYVGLFGNLDWWFNSESAAVSLAARTWLGLPGFGFGLVHFFWDGGYDTFSF